MRARAGLFWQSFFLTLLVVLPMVGTLAWFTAERARQLELRQAAAAQSGVAQPVGAQNTLRLLAAVQAEEPEFLLVRFDCPSRTLTLCGVPGALEVDAPSGTTTLAAGYLNAGPARAAQLLGDTLGVAPDAYLAATAPRWAALAGDAAIRFDTAAVLSQNQRTVLGLETDPVAELTAGDVTGLLQRAVAEAGLSAEGAARMRAAAWTAFLRQTPELLPALPDALRAQSAYTLTDLTAQDLYTLEDTVRYLAGQPGVTIDYEVLTGSEADGVYLLDETGRALALTLLG